MSSAMSTPRKLAFDGTPHARINVNVMSDRRGSNNNNGPPSARRYSHAPVGVVNSVLPDPAPNGCFGCVRACLGRLKLPHSPFWLRRAAPVIGTMCFEVADVASDVTTYMRVVAPSDVLNPVFKRNYLAWCCISVVVSLLAVLWYMRSLAIGYLDFKHNIMASSSAVVSQDAINVVGVKSRLQVSMLLVVVEDLPSVALNGWVLFGMQQRRCVAHSWPVLMAFIFSCFSLGYKLAAYQTFWQFRHVLEEWEQKRGLIDVLEQAFERTEDARTGGVWMRVREIPTGYASPDRRAGVDDDRPQWHGLVTDSVLNVAALANPRLMRLDVSSLHHLADATWEALERHCPQLQELSAWGFDLVGDGHGVGAPLSVLSPPVVTDAVVSLACAMCPNLCVLDLSHCALTDEGVGMLAQRAPELSTLTLAFAKQLTDHSAYSLANGAPRLRSLNLRCTPISDEAAEELRERPGARERLAELEVEGPSFWLLHLLEWAVGTPSAQPQPAPAQAAPPSARTPLSPVNRALRFQLRRLNSVSGKAALAPSAREPLTVVRVRRLLAPSEAWTDVSVPPTLQLTDAHLEGLAIRRPDVAVLDLTRCAHLTGQAAHAISQLEMLRRLSLRDCSQIALHDVRLIAQGCCQLEELDLEGTWQRQSVSTDPTDFRLVLTACPRLRLLVCNRTSLNDDCVHQAVSAGEALAELRAWHCEHLTRSGVATLQQHRPGCELVQECRSLDLLHGLDVRFPSPDGLDRSPAAGGGGAADGCATPGSASSSAIRLRMNRLGVSGVG